MNAISRWLKRLHLSIAEPERFREQFLRVFVPGSKPLALNDWLFGIAPVCPGQGGGTRSSPPEAMSMLRFLDTAKSLGEQQQLAEELATLISLALGRRVIVLHDIAARHKGTDRVTMIPWTHAVDSALVGPLPDDPRSLIAATMKKIAGLPEEALTTIGAASSLYHGAVTLFDSDIRSAYALLIAGSEVLSRAYGHPPTDWAEWEESRRWEKTFKRINLDSEQSQAVRSELMNNKQLRLKATFKSYVLSRLQPSFWEKPWLEWTPVINASSGELCEPIASPPRKVRNILSEDREGLAQALGLSYNLRSKAVHEGIWVSSFEMTAPPAKQQSFDARLRFSVLRTILGYLIETEIDERTTDNALPDIRIAT